MKLFALLENMDLSTWLALLIKVLSSALFFLFGKWQEAYAYAIILVLIDLATGLWAANKRNEIKSSILREKTKDKFWSYLLIVASAFAVEKLLVASHIPIDGRGVSSALVFIGTGELISVAENLEAATGRKFKFWEKLLPAAPEKGTKDESTPSR